MAFRLRPSDLAAIFEVYLLAVGLGALKTALDTTGPWYEETVSLWVYASTFLASSAMLAALGVAAVLLIRSAPHEASASSAGGAEVQIVSPPTEPVEADVEGLLTVLEQTAEAGMGLRATSRSKSVTRHAMAPAAKKHRLPTRQILVSLMGPIVTAAVFAGLSAALLPGAAGFDQTFFTVNTFAILFLSYGWIGLIAYTLSSMVLVASRT